MQLGAILSYGAYLVCEFFIYVILTVGLNIQFGLAGIPNFTFITFVAVGAYITGVTGLSAPPAGSGIHYILGLSLPFPLTLLAGTVAAAILGFLLGLAGLRRFRGTYLAIVTFGFGFIAYDAITNYPSIFDGFNGIAGVAPPLNDVLQISYEYYPFAFAVISGIAMLVTLLLAHRIRESGLGRTLRAIREDPESAEALGKNAFRFQLVAMVVGCALAGLGGGLLIELVSATNPAAWLPPETFIVYAALLVGGTGNTWGAVLGAFLVPILFVEGSRFIPVPSQYAIQFAALRLMVVGVLIIVVLWFRPKGALPEPRKVFGSRPEAGRMNRSSD